MIRHWVDSLRERLADGLPVVRMAVATVRGSAPREPGATLLYWIDAEACLHSEGSIGGGHLEFRAMEIARHLLSLAEADASPRSERFTLGATLGQCCGGVVELYWERFDRPAQADQLKPGWRWSLLDATPADGDGHARDVEHAEHSENAGHAGRKAGPAGAAFVPAADSDPGIEAAAGIVVRGGRRYFVERIADERTELYLYGAGHVGKALVGVLAGLPFRIHWIDSRPGMGESVIDDEAPEHIAAAAPAQAWHLVMTHSHDEDFRICEALVAGGRFGFLGVIGSATKQARFRSRLLQRGHDPAAVARMQSPIGIAGITSKLPAAIAVSVAAQLLQMQQRQQLQPQPQLGPQEPSMTRHHHPAPARTGKA